MSKSGHADFKFNKNRCRKCKYRKRLNSALAGSVFCDYAGVTDQTCLHVVSGKLVDRRGEDYNDCKLYVTGDPVSNSTAILFRQGRDFNG